MLLVTTDAVVEGRHFPPEAPARRVGSFAAEVNLSDLAAKGGVPAGMLVALLLPPSTPVAWVDGVLQGMEDALAPHSAHLLGGDTKGSRQRAIVPTALGFGSPGKLMPRTGARPGDVLAVTGTVGRGGAATLAFRHGLLPRTRAIEALLDVRARLREGQVLRSRAHAALDISDGLAASAHLLARASRVRILLDAEGIPWDPSVASVASRLRRDPWQVAFTGGDYELLVALSRGDLEAAQEEVRRVGGSLTRVGTVERGRGVLLVRKGRALRLPSLGWDAFQGPRGGPALRGPLK